MTVGSDKRPMVEYLPAPPGWLVWRMQENGHLYAMPRRGGWPLGLLTPASVDEVPAVIQQAERHAHSLELERRYAPRRNTARADHAGPMPHPSRRQVPALAAGVRA